MKGVKHELVVGALAAGNVASGLVLQLVVLTLIGPGRATDAFFAAAAIPTVIAGVLGVVLPAFLVPRWSASEQATQLREARSLLVVILGGLGLASLALGAAAGPAFSVLYPGFAEADRQLAAHLFRIQLPGMVATVASSVLLTLWAARLRFVGVELATLCVSIIAIGALVVGLPLFGISLAAWVSSGRAVSLFLILLPAISDTAPDTGSRFSALPVLRNLVPLTAANAYFKSEVLVDRHLVSSATPGDLSLYSLAHQIYASGSGVLGKVWGSNAVPALSRCAASRDRAAFLRLYRRNLALLAIASLSAMMFIALGAEAALSDATLAERVGAGNAQRISLFLMLLGGVLVGGSSGALLAGAFYSLGDTRTPTAMSVVTFTIFMVLRFAAFRLAGIEGMCIAVSAHYMTNALLLALLFPRALRSRLP